MRLLALVLALSTGQADDLGSALRQDGYRLRPPEGFRMARMDLFHGTHAGVVSGGDAARYLSAALMDGDGEDAATMLVGVVEAPLTFGPSARDEAATAVLRHFRDRLELPFVLERADAKGTRVEVLGSVREAGQLRRILVAFWAGEPRHVTVLVSAPSSRWEGLAAAIAASLDTMRPTTQRPARAWSWAFASVVAALLVASVGLWRRRQQRLGRG